MIFQHTINKVMSGDKTQTRRIVKPEHRAAKVAAGTPLEFMSVGQSWGDIVAVRGKNARDVYAVKNTYAVQSGRGKAALWISPNGAIAEGVEHYWDIEYEECRRDNRGWMKEMGWREARIQITQIRQE